MLRRRFVSRAAAGAVAAAALLAPATQVLRAAPTGDERIHAFLWTNYSRHVAPEGATFMNPKFPRRSVARVGSAYVETACQVATIRVRLAAGRRRCVWQGGAVGTITQAPLESN